MTSPHAHLIAQDGTPWRGLGVAALILGGCVFLALVLLHMVLCAVRDLLIWLVGPKPKDDE